MTRRHPIALQAIANYAKIALHQNLDRVKGRSHFPSSKSPRAGEMLSHSPTRRRRDRSHTQLK
ncbi:hypothetical protein [Microcoleus sp. CAWBG58]|uniref:hypothetical protein n=1 Tax=Microcoleus sp. CAWBG58 TaxID=2841651 RepID=UPI0025EA0FB8|nr:hypothetical protein [Microcoleus sp. CAWBG58]